MCTYLSRPAQWHLSQNSCCCDAGWPLTCQRLTLPLGPELSRHWRGGKQKMCKGARLARALGIWWWTGSGVAIADAGSPQFVWPSPRRNHQGLGETSSFGERTGKHSSRLVTKTDPDLSVGCQNLQPARKRLPWPLISPPSVRRDRVHAGSEGTIHRVEKAGISGAKSLTANANSMSSLRKQGPKYPGRKRRVGSLLSQG